MLRYTRLRSSSGSALSSSSSRRPPAARASKCTALAALLLSIAVLVVLSSRSDSINETWVSTREWSIDAYSQWLDGSTASVDGPANVTIEQEDPLAAIDIIEQTLQANAQEDEDGPEEVPAAPVAVKSVCERTVLYNMQGRHGFSAEFGIMLKVALVAAKLDYTMFIQDDAWNYGSLADYFDIPEPDCVPPPADAARKSMKFPQSPSETWTRPVWVRDNHLKWKRDVEGLDRLIVNMLVDRKALASIPKSVDIPLSASQTLPDAFKLARQALSEESRRWWIPNERIRSGIDTIESRLSAKSGSTVVGVHIRRGDKFLEINRIKEAAQEAGSSRQRRRALWGNHNMPVEEVRPFVTAAVRAVNSLAGRGESDDTGGWTTNEPKPVLVLMSDQPGIAAFFAQDERSSLFEILTTDESDETVEDPFDRTNGFHETNFNRLPREKRVELGAKFVRDATFIAKHTDAIVMTGSSNVGRLLGVLADDAVVDQHVLYSTDVRWYPTSRYL